MIKIFKYGEVDNGSIFDRTTKAASTEKTVSEIIADVRKRGDTALYEYSEKFDNAKKLMFNNTHKWLKALNGEAHGTTAELKKYCGIK